MSIFHFNGARLAPVLALVASAALGCGGSDEDGDGDATSSGAPPTKETYVLVHGAFAGAWGWAGVTPLLEAEGHEVITLDLPAHGDDQTPIADANLDSYTAAVVERVDAAGQPVILVGHSMGGQVISQVAEQRAAKVKKLVYVAAFLLPDGTSLLQGSGGDTESKLTMYIEQGEGGTASLAKEGIEGAFCTDCSPDQAAEVEAHLRPEPVSGFITPIETTADGWGSVPRVYIETKQDAAVGPIKQKEMYTALPCEKVLSIDSGHCPFLTKPQELGEALMDL